MKLLSAEAISKTYTEEPLLKDVFLYLNDTDKIGIVGTNGAGKSTFLKILAGISTPDSGEIIKSKGTRINYLPQNPDFEQDNTILEQVFAGVSAQERDLKTYQAKTILTQLGITDFDKNVRLLSGGQKKRVAIASALVTPCEILILDEPTNHIDNDMVLWLEKYLCKFTGALVMVTHDRYFLDRITNQIIEVSGGALYSYSGNFSTYLALKAQREEMAVGTERKRQALLRTELAWIKQGPRARSTKSRSRIERFEQLSQQEAQATAAKLELGSVSSRLGKKIVDISHISKAYGSTAVIRDFSYTIQRDARVGIIGKNGCGKSTLLKMIAGVLTPDTGMVDVGQTVKFGYFSQECEEMDLSLRVIDYIRQTAEYIETTDGTLSASQMLEKFLFFGDAQWNTIARLSGGERRRLYLLRLIMDAPNVLLLDEPTNDFDIDTLMILEDFLETFAGAVLVVSHDRYFLDKTVDYILEVRSDGSIQPYLGGYTDYFDQVNTDLKAPKIEKTDKAPRPKSRKLKFSFSEQREYQTIDEDISALETQIASCVEEQTKQASDYTALQELQTQQTDLEAQLADKMERWVYLNDLAEKVENQE